MTKEEAIKNIKEHCYFANLIPQAKEALDMAIKSLEQEPFINKPCISKGACQHHTEDVLDKIREEIIENSIKDYIYHGCGSNELIIDTNEALKIIDKYKAESEVK